jgi:hypothetical protein
MKKVRGFRLTTPVVYWSEFLATVEEVPGLIFLVVIVLERCPLTLVRINEEQLE